MISVVPAILPDSFEALSAKASRVRSLVDTVQLDVANGSYAPSTTWPYNGADAHTDALHTGDEGLPFWEELNYEVDLLIANPEKELQRFIDAGVSGAVVHIESTSAHEQIYTQLKASDMTVGWGFKPSTSLETLFAIVRAYPPDFVQCMGNDAIGYHGVDLDTHVYDIVRTIRTQFPDMPIAVDIGVTRDTAPLLVEAGVTKLVSGSSIFGSTDIAETISFFKNLS